MKRPCLAMRRMLVVGCPAVVFEVRGRASSKLLDLEVVVHHRARRCIAPEHQAVRFSLKISGRLMGDTRTLRRRAGQPIVGHERQSGRSSLPFSDRSYAYD